MPSAGKAAAEKQSQQEEGALTPSVLYTYIDGDENQFSTRVADEIDTPSDLEEEH